MDAAHSVTVAPTATAGAGAVTVTADGAELGGAPGEEGATDGKSQKLHACRNCQKAKTACTDQRPCARYAPRQDRAMRTQVLENRRAPS